MTKRYAVYCRLPATGREVWLGPHGWSASEAEACTFPSPQGALIAAWGALDDAPLDPEGAWGVRAPEVVTVTALPLTGAP